MESVTGSCIVHSTEFEKRFPEFLIWNIFLECQLVKSDPFAVFHQAFEYKLRLRQKITGLNSPSVKTNHPLLNDHFPQEILSRFSNLLEKLEKKTQVNSLVVDETCRCECRIFDETWKNYLTWIEKKSFQLFCLKFFMFIKSFTLLYVKNSGIRFLNSVEWKIQEPNIVSIYL